MRVIQLVGHRDMGFIPPVIAGLVAANQENRSAASVKGLQRSVGASFVLGAQLAHVTVV